MAAFCSGLSICKYLLSPPSSNMNFHLLSKLHIALKRIQKRGRNTHCTQSVINLESLLLVLILRAFIVLLSAPVNRNALLLCFCSLGNIALIFLGAGLRLVTSIVIVVFLLFL